jgi:hypothetical protein
LYNKCRYLYLFYEVQNKFKVRIEVESWLNQLLLRINVNNEGINPILSKSPNFLNKSNKRKNNFVYFISNKFQKQWISHLKQTRQYHHQGGCGGWYSFNFIALVVSLCLLRNYFKNMTFNKLLILSLKTMN